jgi:hypothetical protein
MIERIPGLPENVLAFAAKGKVTAEDYESVIIPAVESLLAHQRKARFLYHIGKDCSGFEAGAMWDDAKVGLRHLASWERVAVVTDTGWIRAAVKAFGILMPGHVRVFDEAELDAAKRWISE